MSNPNTRWSSNLQPSQLLNQETQPAPRLSARPRSRRPPIGLYMLTGALALLVLLCVSVSLVLAAIGPGKILALRDRWLGRDLGETVSTLGQVAQVLVTEHEVWPGPAGSRVTILLMGIDARHTLKEGASRTDVLTLVTLDPISHTAALLSIPRDLYVPLPGLDQQRINTAYYWGEVNHLPGGGPALIEKTIQQDLGVAVQRYAVIDFEGFKKIVDAVGGVEIDVPHKIVDTQYPTPDYGTETLTIPAGRIHMDGELALKYVRTRHADSDLGRNTRQQQVLLAIRDKALSLGSLDRLPDVLNAVGDSLQTDLTLPEMLSLAKQWGQISRENIQTYRIDETMIKPYVTPQGGQVLLPDWGKVAGLTARFLGQ